MLLLLWVTFRIETLQADVRGVCRTENVVGDSKRELGKRRRWRKRDSKGYLKLEVNVPTARVQATRVKHEEGLFHQFFAGLHSDNEGGPGPERSVWQWLLKCLATGRSHRRRETK